jgi:hypothetical protein
VPGPAGGPAQAGLEHRSLTGRLGVTVTVLGKSHWQARGRAASAGRAARRCGDLRPQ